MTNLLDRFIKRSEQRLQKYTTKEILLRKQDLLLEQPTQPDVFYKSKIVSELETIITFEHYYTMYESYSAPDVALTRSWCALLVPENRVEIRHLMQSVSKHIYEKFFLCRTISPPARMRDAVVIVVDDPEGILSVRLFMENLFPPKNKQKLFELLPVGMLIVVKNPCIEKSLNGGYSLRTENSENVIFLHEYLYHEVFPSLIWKGNIPTEYVNLMIKANPKSAEEWKVLGNEHFSKNNFIGALNAYTAGLKEDPQSLVLLSNRSETYLQLQVYELALNDVNEVMKGDPHHVKAIYRKVRALTGLKKYDEALGLFENVKSSNCKPSDLQQLMTLKSNVELFMNQDRTGSYNIAFMLRTEMADPSYCFDYAEYIGPVEVRKSPGRGRGLFATEDVKEAQLLIASKAFAFHVSEGGLKHPPDTEVDHTLATLVTRIITVDREKRNEFYQLNAGPEMGFLSFVNGDDANDIDVKRIGSILDLNAFEFEKVLADCVKTCHGIWVLPSFINHSCVDCNSNFAIFGNFMMIRALKAVAKDEEILIPYRTPEKPFAERIEHFKKHSFSCNCRLCQIEKQEARESREKREKLMTELRSAISSQDLLTDDISILMYCVNRLKSLRGNSIQLNFNLIVPYSELIEKYIKMDEFTKAAETFEKRYELTRDTALCDSNIESVAGIITCYLTAGYVNKARKWINEFKKTILVAFGTLEVVDVLEHLVSTKQLMQRKGLLL